jgi:hypothetical protein
MKRARLSLIVLSAVLIFGVTFAAAESDNAALIIKLDEGCEWQFGGLTAAGRLHYEKLKMGSGYCLVMEKSLKDCRLIRL